MNGQTYAQALETSLLLLAGKTRLPPKLEIKEKKVDDTESMISMELDIQEYIKSKGNFNKLLHDAEIKKVLLSDIIEKINNFVFEIKSSYIKLWEAFISGNYNEKELKPIVDIVISKINNKKIKTQVGSSIRTKLDKVIKTILNITPPFVSIFRHDAFEKLSKSEQLIQTNIDRLNITHTTRLDTFLDVFNLVNEDDTSIKQFYSEIIQITSPEIRNDYYNKLFSCILQDLTIKVGEKTKLTVEYNIVFEHIFIQIYLYMITMEPIKKVLPIVDTYLHLKSINWFSYQVNNFTTKLHPNWNFKSKGFIFDPWQIETINAIDKKENILLDLPTSGGKTWMAAHAIRNNQRVCYIVPTEALAYQLTGIMLASLNDIEKTGETPRNVRQETANFSYKKFPEHTDDIIIATPIEFWNLLSTKNIDPKFDYIIIDEFHMITDNKIGVYIEYILKFALWYKISIMCLSATIPNYLETKAWIEKLSGKNIFMVNERRRFFNQTRMTIKDNKLLILDPLQHMTSEIVKRNDFTHIGLYPKEIVSLYNKVLAKEFPIDEKTVSLVTLDKLDKMERDIFTHLKKQPNEKLESIFNNKPNINLDDLNASNELTTYKLFLILKECKNRKMTPALVFKRDSKKCLDIYYKMITMLKELEILVYGNFRDINHIIELYNESVESNSENLEIDKKKDKRTDKKSTENTGEKKDKSDELITIEDHKDKIKENLFKTFRVELEEFYKNYVNEKINKAEITEFNRIYGADITVEFIKQTRTKYAAKELKCCNSPDNIFPKDTFTPHPDYRLINTGANYNEKKKIYRSVNSSIKRDNMLQKDRSKHVEKEKYTDPFMTGIEYGILCYNKLLNPAIQRMCQQLINDHLFITFTDESLAVGINYPIKTVMLLGGIDGDPIEEIDNVYAHQACGRAGRRGLDSEGFIIYAGVNIKNILIPSYTLITRNPIDKLQNIFCSHDSEEFKKFMMDEIRSEINEELWSPTSIIDFDKIANEMFLLQTTGYSETTFEDEDTGNAKKIITVEKTKTFEEIKAELISRHTTKVKVKVVYNNTSNELYDTYVKPEEENVPVKIEIEMNTYDNWEDAADELLNEDNNNNKLKESIKNVESSFM